MTPAIEPETIVEYELRCFCGAQIVTTEKTVMLWRWERVSSVSGKKSFGTAGTWPKLRDILSIGG
jgi:hypothetical protein